MRQGRRFGLSAAQKTDVWSRWKAGQSLHEIGRAFGKDTYLDPLSVVAARRDRSGCSSPLAAEHSRWLSEKTSREGSLPARRFVRSLRGCSRAASTVSREVARHGGRPAYRANDADRQAWDSALRPKRCLLAVNHEVAGRSLRVN